jgi:hypothetical protein
LPTVGPAFAALSELPPAFALSALAGIAVSAFDPLSGKTVPKDAVQSRPTPQ